MPYFEEGYDSKTLAALNDAFNAVCAELKLTPHNTVCRRMVALSIMVATRDGELDPQQLIRRAVAEVGGRES
jgi:hypothetical protein